MNELNLTIAAARQAEVNLKMARDKKASVQITLGKEIKKLRKKKGMTQLECQKWLARNGLKTSINRAEVPYKGQTHSIESQIKIIDLLR
jgi:beta-lactam-binding protein with PASTA domain